MIDRIADDTDTSFFSDRYLETPAVLDGFDTLARLSRERFGEKIHLVSKCGPKIQAQSKEWLEHHRFTEIAGIPLERVHFCRRREEKAPICKRRGVTHFIDDRYDVLSYLKSVPHLFLFRPRDKDLARAEREPLPGLQVVQSWAEIAEALLDATPFTPPASPR